jgi:hypothetical protein
LRARKWEVPKAKQQFSETEKWRKEHDVARLFETFDTAEMTDAKRFYPRFTGRR